MPAVVMPVTVLLMAVGVTIVGMAEPLGLTVLVQAADHCQ